MSSGRAIRQGGVTTSAKTRRSYEDGGLSVWGGTPGSHRRRSAAIRDARGGAEEVLTRGAPGGRTCLALSSPPPCRLAPTPRAWAAHSRSRPPAHLPSAQVPRPTPAAGGCSDAMGSLHLGPGAGGGGICSQSLPSHSHMSMHTLGKPRLRPSPAPSFGGVPLMVRPPCQESAMWPVAPLRPPPSRAGRLSRGPPRTLGWVNRRRPEPQ